MDRVKKRDRLEGLGDEMATLERMGWEREKGTSQRKG